MQRKLKVYHIRVNVSIMKMTNQPFVIGIALMFYGCLANGHTRTINFIKTTDTLQLLHVVFRHGDRTQERSYPTDRYQDYTYYPVGVGQLTDAGKLREYNIGVYLRETYNNFLTNTYYPGILAANASSVPRCRASMQLVLSALYPPSSIQRWNLNLNWQPIPYDYAKIEEDLLFRSTTACSKYQTFINNYINSRTYQDLYEPYADVLNYLQEHSGIESRVNIALSLYSTLKSQQEWGLELPAWTDLVWPQPITEITKLDWEQLFATEETRAIGAGFLMSKIINDSKLKISNDASVKDTRIYLYSGHDLNIVAVLSWLGTTDLHIQQYGSFLVFEIHNFLGIPFIKVVHQNYETDLAQIIEIPNCGYYCALDRFIKLYTKYLNPYDLCN